MLANIISLIADVIILIAYVVEKLITMGFIKNFRKNSRSKVVAADIAGILREVAKNPRINRSAFSELNADAIIAEYDPNRDEIIQTSVAESVDNKVGDLLRKNNGIVIIED